MAPRTHRSIAHRPDDKISQLLVHHEPKAINHSYNSSYLCSFQPADHEIYLSGQIHPVIDGYYTQMKNILEQKQSEELIKLPGSINRKKSSIGGQRSMGSVDNLNETKKMTHGIVTSSDLDIRKIMYPGWEDIEEQNQIAMEPERESYKLRIHGAKSNSDPTGGRTWKALKYEACSNSETKTKPTSLQSIKKSSDTRDYQLVENKREIRNLILNRDLDGNFLSFQEAIQYLNQVRSALIKTDKSTIDNCRKTETHCKLAKDAIQALSSASSVHIDYSKIRPLIDVLKLEHINPENIQKLWDLFDHHVPLSGFKFGRLIQPFKEDCIREDVQKMHGKQNIDLDHLMTMRLKTAKFRDYDTAGDLISPKPGTPLGLGHVDYFLPRRSEDIKTIFRNFDLDEQMFSDAWKQARKLETCNVNKVSVESFRTILKQQDVKLLH